MRCRDALTLLLLAACGSTTEGSPSGTDRPSDFDPYFEDGPDFAEVDGAGGHATPDACLLPSYGEQQGPQPHPVHYADGSCGARRDRFDEEGGGVRFETRCLDTHCLCLVDGEVACACDTEEPWCTSKSRSCCPEPFL